MNLLEMKHIKKSFDGLEVLKDISLTVSEGAGIEYYRPFRLGEVHAAPLCHHVGEDR